MTENPRINKKEHQPPAEPRIAANETAGRLVYSAGPWPGWLVLRDTFIVWAVVAVAVGAMLFIAHQFSSALYTFLGDWLGSGVSFIIGGVIDWSAIGIFSLVLIMMPFFLIFELSAKQVWIENQTLYRRVVFLGIPRTQCIPFDRIRDMTVSRSAGRWIVNVRYERKLPKLLYVILVYWNEKFTQWGLTLIDAIPTQSEAEWLYTQLAEHITQIPSSPQAPAAQSRSPRE